MTENNQKSDNRDLKIVSRKDNEEIYFKDDGEIASAGENYAGSDDHQANSGLESSIKMSFVRDIDDAVEADEVNKQKTWRDFEKGMED